MATPKKKMSKTRSRRRRAINLRLTPLTGLVHCANCDRLTRPHSICVHCSSYKGELVH